MSPFRIHTFETAPEGSKEPLKFVKERYGFIPNLMATMSASPAAAKGYLQLIQLFEQSAFTPVEQQVVLLTVSFENNCSYCMSAHSMVATMAGMPPEILTALRQGAALADEKLDALRSLTRKLVQEHGWVTENDLQAFFAAGYSEAQVFDLIVGIAAKTLSNYVNHVAGVPLDAAFQAHVWSSSSATAADSPR